MKKKFHVKKGAEVKVIAGAHKGKTGKIAKIIASKDRVEIEGVNVRKVFVKPSQANPNGGVKEKEFSIHISNVSPIK